MESVHDLFARVREHPDFVFGTIFVRADFTNDKQAAAIAARPKYAEETMTAAGFDYIETDPEGAR